MPKLYDETMTATQVAVAKEYRRTLREFRAAEEAWGEAQQDWENTQRIVEPQLEQLRSGMRELGLDPEDFDGAS